MEEVDCLMDEFEKYDGKVFNVYSQLKTSVLNVICFFIFGKRFGYKDVKFKQLMDLLNKLFEVFNFFSLAFIFFEISQFKIFYFEDVNSILKVLVEFIGEMIEEYRRDFDENDIKDYIDVYFLEQKNRIGEINIIFIGELQINCMFKIFNKR